MRKHPAKRSRLTAVLVSVIGFIYTVAAMYVNGVNVKPTSVSPTPIASKTTSKRSKVVVQKLTKKKKKVHAVSGASKKR